MMIIPAVDLKDGRCVRLCQGRMDRESIYSEDPIQMARHWEAKGAERLHVVDLNGAQSGRPVQQPLIKEIAASLRIPVEVGGGIRDIRTIETYLASGIQWVILGTVALRDHSLVEEACRAFSERIILGIDARRGKVAIEGWKEEVPLGAIELARRYEGVGLASIIYTDIERDGMGTGLNWEATRSLARSISIPIIASGGVADMRDIERLMSLEDEGVIGVVVGRALYTGQIDLEEALRLAKKAAREGGATNRC